jgi:hypothetical protein
VLLRQPGVFMVPVPEGWEAFGVEGSHYLLTPAGRTGRKAGEIRFAVFPRSPEPFAEREGADRLVELLDELGVNPDDAGIAFRARYGTYAHRAFAWFPGYDENGHDVDCLAAVVVLRPAVLACTAMASPRNPEIISTAELFVAAMTPDDARHRR